MIRADLIVEKGGLDNMQAFLDTYPDLAKETVVDTFNRDIKPNLLNELRHTPGKVKYPFQFATDRSRRAYFATGGFGSGIPYQRTGKLTAGWKADVSISDNAVVMSVSNPVKYLKYVIGKRQVPGHRTTGWPLFAPTVDFWETATMEVVVKALNRLINQIP